MFVLRVSLAVGLTLALTGALVAAPKGRRGNSRHGIEGTVVKVHHDRTHGRAGWIKVRHVRHHNRGRRGSTSVAASLGRNRSRRGGQVMTFPVNSSTRFERQGRGRNGRRASRVSFQAVHAGERVRVYGGSGRSRAAREVLILSNSNRGASHRRRHVHRRHPLVNSAVLSRHHRRHHLAMNRFAGTRSALRHASAKRHPPIHGRVASQQARRVTAATVKQGNKNRKQAPVKQTIAKTPVKHTNHKPAARHTNHKSSAKHASSHSRSSRRKR